MTATLTKNEIITNLYNSKNFNDCIHKMEPVHLQDDLKAEVISIVCEWPENKVVQLHQDKALEFYVVRVILNQVKSKTSPFVRKYRSTSTIEITQDLPCIQEDCKEREVREEVERLAINEIDSLYWYDAEMIRLYLKLGSFRAIQEYTDIPFISCYKNIKKSLATLKKKAIEKAVPLFSKEELLFIQNNKIP
jgi:hypothetical protein